MDGPDAHRIEHRSDPGGGQFCIMGKKSRQMGPIDLGARLDVAFDIVGMQLHKTRKHQIPAAIQSPSWDAIPFSDFGNDTRFNRDRPKRYPIWQNKLSIGKTKVC